MRTIVWLIWALALSTVIFRAPEPAQAQVIGNRALINSEVDHSNLLVNRGCSGTVIGDKLVLTASHCVMDQFEDVPHKVIGKEGKVKTETIRISTPGTVAQITYTDGVIASSTRVVFKVKAIDGTVDLALLTLTEPLGTPVKVACTKPLRGDPVWAVGNPFGILYSSLSAGVVGSLDRSYRDLQIAGQLSDATDTGEHSLIQHTALIAPGNSGGALYNTDGDLIGVNVRGGAGFAFAVKLTDVRKFLSDNGVEISKCGENP